MKIGKPVAEMLRVFIIQKELVNIFSIFIVSVHEQLKPKSFLFFGLRGISFLQYCFNKLDNIF